MKKKEKVSNLLLQFLVRGGIMILTEKVIALIEAVLQKGNRVELIPNKEGVRVIKVKREEIK